MEWIVEFHWGLIELAVTGIEPRWELHTESWVRTLLVVLIDEGIELRLPRSPNSLIARAQTTKTYVNLVVDRVRNPVSPFAREGQPRQLPVSRHGVTHRPTDERIVPAWGQEWVSSKMIAPA